MPFPNLQDLCWHNVFDMGENSHESEFSKAIQDQLTMDPSVLDEFLAEEAFSHYSRPNDKFNE
jgi:hypothetical protein